MSVQLLDKPDTFARLGTSLGTGLQALAQQKLGQMQLRNQQAQRYHAGTGSTISYVAA